MNRPTEPELSASSQQRLLRYQQEYRELKKKLAEVGFVLQGSVTTRWMQCGKASCGCHRDARARHGPYYQWSWKDKGRTASVYLSPPQAELCKEWIANHREMKRVMQRMRNLSLRMARLYGIRQ